MQPWKQSRWFLLILLLCYKIFLAVAFLRSRSQLCRLAQNAMVLLTVPICTSVNYHSQNKIIRMNTNERKRFYIQSARWPHVTFQNVIYVYLTSNEVLFVESGRKQ
jgi:hypothetical protein